LVPGGVGRGTKRATNSAARASEQPPADKDKQPNPAAAFDGQCAGSKSGEDSASKPVQQTTDPNKRIQLAEDFLKEVSAKPLSGVNVSIPCIRVFRHAAGAKNVGSRRKKRLS